MWQARVALVAVHVAHGAICAVFNLRTKVRRAEILQHDGPKVVGPFQSIAGRDMLQNLLLDFVTPYRALIPHGTQVHMTRAL